MVCYLFCFVLQLVTTVDVDSLNLEKLDCEYPASSPPYESVSQTTKAAVNMSSLVIEVGVTHILICCVLVVNVLAD